MYINSNAMLGIVMSYHAIRYPESEDYIEIYVTDGCISATLRIPKSQALFIANDIIKNKDIICPDKE